METKELKILILEDVLLDADMTLRQLKKANILFRARTVVNRSGYLAGLHNFRPDIILSDHALPNLNSLEALELAIANCGKIPFILVTGTMTEDFAIEIMKRGAWDYVSKSQLERLPDVIKKAMIKFEEQMVRQNFLFNLIRNEASLDLAEHLANYGSWELDVMSNKLKFSKGAYRILGYLMGDPILFVDEILRIIHPLEQVRVRHLIQHILGDPQGEVYSETFQIVDVNGACRLVKTAFMIKLDSTGQPSKINGIVQPLAPMELVQLRLDECEQRFLGLADSLGSAAVITLDNDGHVIGLNREARVRLEYDVADVLNRHLSVLFGNPQSDNLQLTEFVKDCRGHSFETTGFFTTRTGTILSGRVNINVCRNKMDNPFGFLVVIYDMNAAAPILKDMPALLQSH